MSCGAVWVGFLMVLYGRDENSLLSRWCCVERVFGWFVRFMVKVCIRGCKVFGEI